MSDLARYNAQLEALAFDEPWDDEIAARTIEDKTQPLYEIMHKVSFARASDESRLLTHFLISARKQVYARVEGMHQHGRVNPRASAQVDEEAQRGWP